DPIKRALAFLSACILCMTAGGMTAGNEMKTASADASGKRFIVDLNANDNRFFSTTPTACNWAIASGSSASASFNGLTFKLSNGGSVGSGIKSVDYTGLQRTDDSTPTLTMDGVTIDGGEKGGVIKLEISGLSAGTHTLKTWHSCMDGLATSTMSVTVNGKKTCSGIAAVARVKNDDAAAFGFSTFDVTAGQTVTVLIQPEGNGSVNNAYLNAFEIDAGDPVQGISRICPIDNEPRHDQTKGLSWTAGKNAASHDVYIGTDYNSVLNATHSFAEFQGNQTANYFALNGSHSSLVPNYWRVDTIDKNGNVIKGAVYSFTVARKAFPTAEGYGADARGGRGGRIIEVTNLNDSGEGSLRQALEVEKGPRIVVFRVGGVIALKSRLIIPRDGGDVYVAGQTAPGDGITLINYDMGAEYAEDIVIRDMRVRPGDYSGQSMGGMGLRGCNHCIIDHCSISWSTDEGFSSREAKNITFQRNIIAEALHESVHYSVDRTSVSPHAFAASISGNIGSFHHNLLAHCTDRNWSLAGGYEKDGISYGGSLDITNNVVYNWQKRTTDGGVGRLKFVSNYYKMGPVSADMALVVISDNAAKVPQKVYAFGNKMTDINGKTKLDPSQDAWEQKRATSTSQSIADTRTDDPMWDSLITVQSADKAYEDVLSNVGANAQGLDMYDSRYIKETKNGTYTYSCKKSGLY
ncbi:MAG: hypothetical protein II916_03205, partial [Oscillospiraceae bacterium]|nr:hypothetical protein [Oscillospiraceae bacterium]